MGLFGLAGGFDLKTPKMPIEDARECGLDDALDRLIPESNTFCLVTQQKPANNLRFALLCTASARSGTDVQSSAGTFIFLAQSRQRRHIVFW